MIERMIPEYRLEVKAGYPSRFGQSCIQGIISLVLILSVVNTYASESEYDIKAVYVYQFTKYTEWPDGLFEPDSNSLRICMQGRNLHSKSFDKITGSLSQDRVIVVEHLESLQQLSGCHVVFISRSEEKRLDQILRRTSPLPILTVSDIDGFASRGGIIALVVEGKKIRLKINYDAAREAGLKLSSKLLAIATLVKTH